MKRIQPRKQVVPTTHSNPMKQGGPTMIRARHPSAAVVALMVVAACGTPATRQAPPPIRDLGLSGLYAGVRVPGLEQRDFQVRDYWFAVEPLIDLSPVLHMEELGSSAEGRPIRAVSFGEGSTSVLLWSQMHGNESTATMALADIYAFVTGYPDNPVTRTILENLTVHTVPMLNPDGAQRFQRHNAQGVDINRDARALATPEARTLKELHDRVRPMFGFNLHDQGVGTRVGDSDRGVAIALLSPPFDETRAVNDVRRRAIQVAGVVRDAVESMVGGHIARYDDSFNPRAFGDLMTSWGTSVVLIESGGWEDDPQKQYLREVNFVGILTALESIARGGYASVSLDRYGSLPENGRRVAGLLLRGGALAVPGLPPLRADLLINFENTSARTGGVIAEIGDLHEAQAMDTVSIDGMFVIPADSVLDQGPAGKQIRPGAVASFTVAHDPEGRRVEWVFRGRMPPGRR